MTIADLIRTRWRPVALALPLVTASALVAVPAYAAAEPTDDSAVSSPTVEAFDGDIDFDGVEESDNGRYIVVMRTPAAASQTSAGQKFKAQRQSTQEYVAHIEAEQQQVADDAGVTPLTSYSLTTNGFAAELSLDEANEIALDPRVLKVVPDEILHVQDANASTSFLGLEGENGVWAGLGGAENAGKGIVIGVIDTGIAPENPSFAGDELGTTDGDEPFRDGDEIVFHKADGSDFRGMCETGEQFSADDCNTKVIGAQYFLDGFGADWIGDASIGEYVSPRDGGDHGSHTASTAAGNPVTTDQGAGISGVAPAAKIAAYKACWSGPDPADPNDDGCATSDLLGAIDAATHDGVDVINYSIGGAAATSTNSLTDQAFMRAAEAGIFVSAAGGNAGPGSTTLDNASPWITTVAASTIPDPSGTITLGDGTATHGASISVREKIEGELIDARDAGLDGVDAPENCAPDALDPAKVEGKIVLCDREGVVERLQKSAEVARAGGIGMVLVNTNPGTIDIDPHAVPTVHVDSDRFEQLHAYAATDNPTVTLEPGNLTDEAEAPTPQIADFSSRGPVEADGSDLIKPDLAAPGVNILAAYANPEGGQPQWGYMSGTSMATPHVAGLAALYLGEHPNAAPSEVKSALMTSTMDTLDADGNPVSDPFSQGNGQVVPKNYLAPGLVYNNGSTDWQGYLAGIGEPGSNGAEPIDGSDLNLPSIGIGSLSGTQTVTRTVTALEDGTWTASVTGMAGVDVAVEPSSLDLAAGEEGTFTVTFTRTDAWLGEFATGMLTWTNEDGKTVRDALAVRPVAFEAPDEVAAEGTTGSVDLDARFGDTGDYALSATDLTRGTRVTGSGFAGEAPAFALTVPQGALFARFDLDADDKASDLDLAVFKRNSSGSFVLVGQSGTESGDEQVDVLFPSAGDYVIQVALYSAGATEEIGYALTTYVAQQQAEANNLTLDPAQISGTVGDTATVTASWNDLEPGAYLGLVSYGDTGVRTLITVDAGDDIPVEPGDAALTVSPSAADGEWVTRGSELRVRATGLTPGASYSATIDDDDTAIRTGTATSNGVIDWSVTVSEDITAGAHTLHLAGEGADLEADFQVSPMTLISVDAFPRGTFDGRGLARLDVSYSGPGDLNYKIQSADGKNVYYDETRHVGMPAGFPQASISTDTVEVGHEPFVGIVTVMLEDGSEGPSLATEPMTIDEVEPGSITFTPQEDNGSLIDVDFVNNSFSSFQLQLTYLGCDGRYTVASGFVPDKFAIAPLSDQFHQTWNMTGYTHLDVRDEFGNLLASYDNDDEGRCATEGIEITNDLWATATATPQDSDDYDPERPITLEMGFHAPKGAAGFGIAIGHGADRFSGDDFFTGSAPASKDGSAVTRSVTLKEGQPDEKELGSYVYVDWEAVNEEFGIITSGSQYVELPPLTVEFLKMSRAGVEPGDGSGNPGEEPENPGNGPGAPGDQPETPGAPGDDEPGDGSDNPGEDPGNGPGTPGEQPENPGVPGDQPGDGSGNGSDTPGEQPGDGSDNPDEGSDGPDRGAVPGTTPDPQPTEIPKPTPTTPGAPDESPAPHEDPADGGVATPTPTPGETADPEDDLSPTGSDVAPVIAAGGAALLIAAAGALVIARRRQRA